MTRPLLAVRYDLRLPDGDGKARAEQYECALAQVEWAEAHGFVSAVLSEHHGSPDGYLPSPLVMAGAVAARTSRMMIAIAALIAPLHDPVRLAEDLAVLDVLSRGRIMVTIGAGYVAEEFAMFGRALDERGTLVEDAITVMRKAWSGETFTYDGRTISVTPLPFTDGGPPIMLGGGSRAAARRAARLGVGFQPQLPRWHDDYRAACLEYGRPDPGPAGHTGPTFLWVAEDPDATWERIGPSCLHEMNAYGAWAVASGIETPYRPVATLDELRATGAYPVLTPDELRAYADELGEWGVLVLHPLCGGIDPEESWRMLELVDRTLQ